jgi:hypothetical protein
MEKALMLVVASGCAVALWQWAIRARERVDRISREVCADLALQRLDEAVALRGIRLRRTEVGLAVQRVFSFEFSTSGADRCRGDVCLLGLTPLWVHLEHPDGAIHIDLAPPP